MERLARFDGTTFHPVRPGEIDTPFVHVFAHGWQPGYRVQERMLASTDRVAALPAWDPRLVDATGRALISDYTALLEALAGLGPDHAVLWYSWLDESATDADVFQAFRSRQATQINGRRLALLVQQALAPAPVSPPVPGRAGRRARVHLIGHSHGSAVVTHAAVSMARAPEHLTLLDAPEDPISRVGGASDLIDLVLPRLRPGRGPGAPFVDSYASAFGRPYHRRPGLAAVVDVLLGVPLVLSLDPVKAINAAHLYPVDWYARSVREAGRVGQRPAGYGWSPLRGGDTAALHSWYHSPLPQRPLLLRRHAGEPLGRWRSRLSLPPVPARRPVPGVRLDLDPGTASAAAIVTSASGDQLIEFDLQLRGCAGGEVVEVDLDGVAAFTAMARHPVPSPGRYLMLADSVTGEHLISARLLGATPAARASVVNLRLVSVPHARGRFTLGRSAATVFVAGAVSGSVGTLLTLLVTGLTARKVWERVRRRGPAAPGGSGRAPVSREPGAG